MQSPAVLDWDDGSVPSCARGIADYRARAGRLASGCCTANCCLPHTKALVALSDQAASSVTPAMRFEHASSRGWDKEN